MNITPHIHPQPVKLDSFGLAQIGSTKHEIMGIRYHSDPANPPSQNPPAPAPATPPAGTPATQPNPQNNPAVPLTQPGTGDTPPAGSTPPATPSYTPEQTQAKIAELNAEAKGYREAKEAAEKAASDAQAQRDAALKALGINPDGSAVGKTPEQLASELADRTSAVDETARENLVLRVSGKTEIQGNADAMLDSRSFTEGLKAFKPDDRAGVEKYVTDWVGAHPEHKLAAPAASSSGGVTHAGTQPTTQRKSMSAALDERFPRGGAKTK